MPNWCAGTLRIRGTKENIKEFIEDEFKVCSHQIQNGIYQAIIVDQMYNRINWDAIDYSCDYIKVKMDDTEWIHLKSLHRVFIEWDEDYNIDRHTFFITNFKQEDNKFLVIFPIKQAWGFDVEEWVELSKKYNLDFHLFGWESGLCFDVEIEIQNGSIIKYTNAPREDWYWNTANPFIGG